MQTEPSTPKDRVIEILRECLAEKIGKNPHYSARAFARDIKVSPAFISMLLSGKKKLSLDRAKQISLALDMPERKRNNFLKIVALSSMPSDSSAQELESILFSRQERKDIHSLDVDQFKFFNNWYNVAILDLTTCNNFKSDISWMAEKLQLSQVVVKDAVDRLVRLGLLKLDGNRLKKTNQHITIPTNAPENTVRNFHQQMIDKAKDNLNNQNPDEYERRDISSITFAIDSSKMDEAKKLINDFKNQMADFLTEGNCKDVFQLNIQLFPLTAADKTK
jgi:uncharacterized protein (TIGR02147 family)